MNKVERIIETDRTYLRRLSENDAEQFYLLNNDPEVLRYTGDEPFQDVVEAEVFLKNYNQYELYNCGRWAVISNSEDAFLGWCGIRYVPELNEYDLGYRFFKKYWNQGFATETGRAVIDFGFKNLAFDVLIGRVARANLNSIKVLEKLGFIYSHAAFLHGDEALIYTLSREDFGKAENV